MQAPALPASGRYRLEATRFDGTGNKTSNAHTVIRLNGVVIHDKLALISAIYLLILIFAVSTVGLTVAAVVYGVAIVSIPEEMPVNESAARCDIVSSDVASCCRALPARRSHHGRARGLRARATAVPTVVLPDAGGPTRTSTGPLIGTSGRRGTPGPRSTT